MKYKNFIIVILFILCLAGCSKEKSNTADEQNIEEPAALESSTEDLPGEPMQIANPWRESSEEEIEEIMRGEIDLPGDFSNVYYQVMNEGELCEIDFDYLDLSFTYRMKESGGKEDISGMYYEWDINEVCDINGNGGEIHIVNNENEKASSVIWYDTAAGMTYSVSVNNAVSRQALIDFAQAAV